MVDPITMVRGGGYFMYPIVVCAVIAAAVLFERAGWLLFRAGTNAPAFMAVIQKAILANDIDRAIKLCNADPHAVLPRVVKAGLARANRPEKEIADAVEEATLEVAPLLNRRTPYLSLLANVALLLGLLGTIGGLIEAFDAVAHAPAEAKQRLLAEGIGIAMYTMAAGLYVAIPSYVAYAVLVQRTNRILDEVEQAAFRTVNLLVARRRGILESEPLTDETEPALAEG